ncbi:MAG TPA: zinc ribbon domain-containing protein [Pyrinomonadaceae bacterium]|nr:zinc ribbon domain-containing protein [Pyrinomonadaceae bacterium]
MNNKICPKCGTANPADMSFCINCGQNLSAGGNAPARPDEPPPTVFMNQPKMTDPNNPMMPPNVGAIPPQPPAKKGGKGWIYALAGCFGLLLLSGVGLGILVLLGIGGGFFAASNNSSYPSPSPTPLSNTNRKNDSTVVRKNDSTPETTPPTNDDGGDTSEYLVKILETRKSVGGFKQTDVKTVVTKDYFPQGIGAAQAAYQKGSNYVFLTIGQFVSVEEAKENFEGQLDGVKENGGKVTPLEPGADGTVSAIYERGGFYFAEYCNTNKFCNRIHSENREALRSFISDYAK